KAAADAGADALVSVRLLAAWSAMALDSASRRTNWTRVVLRNGDGRAGRTTTTQRSRHFSLFDRSKFGIVRESVCHQTRVLIIIFVVSEVIGAVVHLVVVQFRFGLFIRGVLEVLHSTGSTPASLVLAA